jgi:hypothetical protein
MPQIIVMSRKTQDKLIIDILIIIKNNEKYPGCLEYLYGPFVNGLSALALLRVVKMDKLKIKPNKKMNIPIYNQIVLIFNGRKIEYIKPKITAPIEMIFNGFSYFIGTEVLRILVISFSFIK